MDSAVLDPEAWVLTVVRAHGLRLMRPDKAWRPIVTVEVDKQSRHEAVLGVDGQNPNLKQFFRFYDVKSTSTLEMKVWHRSQSKKKNKKRNLVAAATHTLGDLMKKVEVECSGPSRGGQISLRLACQSVSKKATTPLSSKGRPQNGALLIIKLTPPRTQQTSQQDDDLVVQEPQASSQSGYTSEAPSSSCSSDAHASDTLIDVQPPSPVIGPSHSTVILSSPHGLRLRRKTSKRARGYSLFSDDELCGAHSGSSDSDESSASGSRSASHSFNSSTSFFEEPVRSTPLDSCFDSDTDEKAESTIRVTTTTENDEVIPLGSSAVDDGVSPVRKWIAASLLPQHALVHTNALGTFTLSPDGSITPYDSITSPPPASSQDPEAVPPYTESAESAKSSNKLWEQFLGNFTFYLDLRDARLDSQYEAILHQLRMEWTFMGGFLAALGAVDVAVLAVGPDSVIPVTPLSLRAIASSSVFTGLGITSLAYFILRYSFAPPPLFRTRALDLYRSYAFFALSARVPTLCMVASAVGLLVFLTLVAFEVWPAGVVVVCFLVGILMSLQFLVYGCHMFIRGVIGVVRRIAGGVRALVLRPNDARPASGGGNVAVGSVAKANKPTAGAVADVV